MSITAFSQEDYQSLRGRLSSYKLDGYIQQLESKGGKNKGLIFPFARGLRFSALLIYEIRKMLSGSNLDANWGQIILDEDGTMSNECDIIIHEKGYYKRWNGEGGGSHIMDFQFIKLEQVKAVISCKSYIKTNTIEIDYFKSLNRHVSQIWLFAECCPKNSVETLKKKTKDIGYLNFWHLYTYEKKQGEIEDAFQEWQRFEKTIRDLGKSS